MTISGNAPPPAGDWMRTASPSTVPESGGVRCQSTTTTTRSAPAADAGIMIATATSTVLANTLTLLTSFLLAVCAQQLAERGLVEPRLGGHRAQPELEGDRIG